MRVLVREIQLAVGVVTLFVAGCGTNEAPIVRQLVCVRTPHGVFKVDKAIFVLDLGRRTAVRANGVHHEKMPLDWDEYVYRFHSRDHAIVIGRYDGMMTVTKMPKAAGQRDVNWVDRWTCSAQKQEKLI